MNPVRVREVVDPSDPAIGKSHDLLRRTFAKAELVGWDEWRETLEERRAGLWSDVKWHLLIAEMRDAVIGVASGTYLGSINTGAIGYLAVSAAARGAGLGPTLRNRLRSLFASDAVALVGRPLRAVIGEVRRDNPWLRRLMRDDRVLPLDFGYSQPRLRRGDKPVPLVLYYESLDRVRNSLPAAVLKKVLYITWQRVYRIARPLAHPEFRQMLAELDERTSIGRLTQADLTALAGS